VKKSIVALAASTLLVGMTISAIPAFADDAPAASGEASSSAPAKPHAKSHKHHASKKSSKKSEESSSAAPK
jgi:hypothetical protein